MCVHVSVCLKCWLLQSSIDATARQYVQRKLKFPSENAFLNGIPDTGIHAGTLRPLSIYKFHTFQFSINILYWILQIWCIVTPSSNQYRICLVYNIEYRFNVFIYTYMLCASRQGYDFRAIGYFTDSLYR